MELINTILKKMSDVFKPQRKFISAVLTTIMLMRGRVNFRNMSRYSVLCEKTFSRQHRNPSDFAQFNRIGTEMVVNPHTTLIAATDCSFIAKSGSHTYGLSEFYDSSTSKTRKGLEISVPAVADADYNTAYGISAWQTPAVFTSGHTRTDRYLGQFIQDAQCLPSSVRYPAADAYYAKKKFADGVCDAGYHLISELRSDANLRYLYTGKQKDRGRPGIYDGKVCFSDLSRSEFVAETENISLYTAVVNSPFLKRNIRVVCLSRRLKNKVMTALLFSTDIYLSAADIYRFYKARFQIGFLFRDAKQFAGLPDCQARCGISSDFHFNASLTALNLMKWESRGITQSDFNQRCSVASVKIRKFNEYLLKKFCDISGIDFADIQSSDAYHRIINLGAIAA